MTLEIVLMWLAVSLYAASAALFVVGLVWRSQLLMRVALWTAVAGLVPQAVAIGVRWVRVDHGPYLGFYEVVSSYAFASVVALAIIAWRKPSLRWVGVFVMPLAFLLIGGAMLAPRSDLAITPTLASWWLTIHIMFAKLSYLSFFAAFAVALAYLARDRWPNRLPEWLHEKLPGQADLDELSFRFIGVGFIFLTIMIVAGAIWANEAWGRYWAWDPIETWSLITWAVYAVYLHTRLTLGWRGAKSAWFAVAALPFIVFTLIGVPLAYQSIHGAYLTGY
ncbi:MAG: c-type cytochrome biogenesis protein CcsB [Coriobacteriales bacterium]|nr:c-type cytochrome biogenesis protein CcsB [Coriobacteriales bacterium]